MAAAHQPQASLSFDREYTSTSMPSWKRDAAAAAAVGDCGSGGRRIWLKRNFDSGCQLEGHVGLVKSR